MEVLPNHVQPKGIFDLLAVLDVRHLWAWLWGLEPCDLIHRCVTTLGFVTMEVMFHQPRFC